jgi:methyl-accepting chemotaxis protein WspA
MRLTDYSIRTRLLGLVWFGMGILLGVIALSSWLIYKYRVSGPVYDQITEQHRFESELEPATLTIVRPLEVIYALATATATDAGETNRLMSLFDSLEASYRETYRKRLVDIPEGPKRASLTESFAAADSIFRIARAEVFPTARGKDGELAALKIIHERIMPLFKEHVRHSEEAVRQVKESINKTEEDVASSLRFWTTLMIVVCLGALLVQPLAGLFLSRGIVDSTRKLIRRVCEMASGASDLTARVAIDSKDEIGQLGEAINAMIAKIQSIVQRVRETSVKLLSTAAEIAATSRQQEGTVHGLSSSTAEIASAVREISATSKELSGTMGEVNQRAETAAALATAGRERLAGMEGTMQQVVQSTSSIASKLALIREKAANINLVVTTITKVADQTNLLSINAAIEAEKAGEYGRGFLVVAREIRRLADQTAVATLDIESMVRHMQDAVSAGVMQVDKFGGEVRDGMARVTEISGHTGQIIEEVHGLSTRFHTVNEGMRNQSLGAQQINEAMGHVSGGAQQTKAVLDELNKATQYLRESVEGLNTEISQFKV